MEFHTMQPVSGIDIASEIVEYTISVTKQANEEKVKS